MLGRDYLFMVCFVWEKLNCFSVMEALGQRWNILGNGRGESSKPIDELAKTISSDS